jgi:hypothetical protein
MIARHDILTDMDDHARDSDAPAHRIDYRRGPSLGIGDALPRTGQEKGPRRRCDRLDWLARGHEWGGPGRPDDSEAS